MKQPIRYLALGILISSLLLLAAFYFGDKQNTESLDNLSVNDMIEKIETEDYRVLTKSEYISLTMSADENENQSEDEIENNDTDKESDSDHDEEEIEEGSQDDEDDAEKYTLEVKQNMLGPEVSELLEENGIIKNAQKFNKLLEDEGYSTLIQLGKHDLTSDMSDKEIAEKISE